MSILFKSNNGFTLIEVIAAMSILALASLPIFGSIYTSLNADQASTVLTEESTIAQNIAEGIKSGDITETHIDEYPLNNRIYTIDITENPEDNGISLYDIKVNVLNSNKNPYLLSFYYKPGALLGGSGGGGDEGGGDNGGGDEDNPPDDEGNLPDDEDSLWGIIKRLVEYFLVILFIAAVVIYMTFPWGPITTLRRVIICLNELINENMSITRQNLYTKLHNKYGFNPSRFFKWVWGVH